MIYPTHQHVTNYLTDPSTHIKDEKGIRSTNTINLSKTEHTLYGMQFKATDPKSLENTELLKRVLHLASQLYDQHYRIAQQLPCREQTEMRRINAELIELMNVN
jgi:hypothetical protein